MKKSKSSPSLLKSNAGNSNLAAGTRSTSNKVPNTGESTRASLSVLANPKALTFGRESKAALGGTSSHSSSSNGLAGLFGSALSGGGVGGTVSSLFGNSGLGAIGSLVSGLASLFGGGKSQPAALPAFALPATQIQNVTVRGSSTETNLTAISQRAGSYGQLPDAAMSTLHYVDQSAQIAQAVKTALLQSHSLSDVISEL